MSRYFDGFVLDVPLHYYVTIVHMMLGMQTGDSDVDMFYRSCFEYIHRASDHHTAAIRHEAGLDSD